MSFGEAQTIETTAPRTARPPNRCAEERSRESPFAAREEQHQGGQAHGTAVCRCAERQGWPLGANPRHTATRRDTRDPEKAACLRAFRGVQVYNSTRQFLRQISYLGGRQSVRGPNWGPAALANRAGDTSPRNAATRRALGSKVPVTAVRGDRDYRKLRSRPSDNNGPAVGVPVQSGSVMRRCPAAPICARTDPGLSRSTFGFFAAVMTVEGQKFTHGPPPIPDVEIRPGRRPFGTRANVGSDPDFARVRLRLLPSFR